MFIVHTPPRINAIHLILERGYCSIERRSHTGQASGYVGEGRSFLTCSLNPDLTERPLRQFTPFLSLDQVLPQQEPKGEGVEDL